MNEISGWSKDDDLRIYIIHVLENSSPMFAKFKQTIGKNPFNANGLYKIFNGKSPYEIDQRAREIGCDLVWGPNDDAIICDWGEYPDTSYIKDLLSEKRTDVQIIARKEFLDYYYELRRKRSQPIDYVEELNDHIKKQKQIEEKKESLKSIYSPLFNREELLTKKKVSHKKVSITKYQWSKEEDDAICAYYKEFGPRWLFRFFKEKVESGNGLNYDKKVYPASDSHIRYRAHKLQVVTKDNPYVSKKKQPWTKHEDDILRKYYPLEGTLCTNRLQGRSFRSVSSRAGNLKLKMTQSARILQRYLKPLTTDKRVLSIHRSNDTSLKPITIYSYNKVLYTGPSSGKTMLINRHRYYMTHFIRKDNSMQVYLIYDINQDRDISISLSYKTEEDFYKDFTVLTI